MKIFVKNIKTITFDYKVVFLFIVEFVTLGSVGPGSIPVNKRTKERKNRNNRFSIFVDIQIWKLSDSSLKIGNCLIRYNLFLIFFFFFYTICLSIFWFFLLSGPIWENWNEDKTHPCEKKTSLCTLRQT